MSAIDGKILLTRNDSYKAYQKMTPKGIVVHSTAANNPYIRRYVQPDDGIIGKNQYGNDWNQSGVYVSVHAFIGKDKNGAVKVYQTLPFDICCWGIGEGRKGSYNFNPAYIQFEMCEDDQTDKKYCKTVYDKSVKFAAYLCKKYGIKPSKIVSHKEAHEQGYGSAHSDPDNWWSKFGYTMDGFRKAVKKKLKEKVKAKRACNLYSKDYKDPVGNSVSYINVKKGTKVNWELDDGYGWSKIKYDGKTYYVMNGNLNKTGLSKCKKEKLSENIKAFLVKKGKLQKPVKTLKKGKTVKIICNILGGKFQGYSYIKCGTKYYYTTEV